MVRVIVIIGRKAGKRTKLMLDLINDSLIEQIKWLTKARRCEDAVSDILANGRFIKMLTDKELAETHSDLVLTPYNAYWTTV